MECELCKAHGEKFRVVHENEHAFAIVIKWPLKDGHVMVLPKRHISSYDGATPEESRSIFELLHQMEKTIGEAYDKDTIVHINRGKNSTEQHIHLHILPSNAGLRPLIGKYENIPQREPMSKEQTEEMKDYIRKFLED